MKGSVFYHAGPEAHAATRWARALVAIVDAHSDPRTLAAWARHIAASEGALRTWCRTVGIPSRRSLLFGRMLRAVHLSDQRTDPPESLLDIADARTLVRMLDLAGFGRQMHLPTTVHDFLDRQQLISDRAALREVGSALNARGAPQIMEQVPRRWSRTRGKDALD